MRTIVHSAVALLFLATAGCDRPAFMTDLALSADRLEFIAPPGSGDPPGQVLYVTNPGEGRLARPVVAIAYSGAATGWLGVTVSEDADAPYRLDVTATAGALAPGIYGATLTLASANAPGSPVQVPVTLAVPGPSFAVDREALAFVAPRGGAEPEVQVIAVTNGGRGTLPVPVPAITYVGRQGWLSVEVGGTPAGYSVSVRAAVGGLETGEYGATIALGAVGVAGPARTLAVSLMVPPPEIKLEATSVTIYGPPVEEDPDPARIRILNGGGGRLAKPFAFVSADSPEFPTWLHVEVTGEAAPFELALRASQLGPPALKRGEHRATVHLGVDGSMPVDLEVLLIVPETRIEWPTLVVTPGRDCLVFPPPALHLIRKVGPGPLARPAATILEGAESWLEARVTGSRYPWTLSVQLKALPPSGVQQARVRLEAPDVTPGEAWILVSEPSARNEVTVSPSSLRFWAQRGLGDPGPATVNVVSNDTCLPPPPLSLQYLSGPPGWVTAEARPGFLRQDLRVRASTAGLAPGDLAEATIELGLAQGDPPASVHVSLQSGDLHPAAALPVARSGYALMALEDGTVIAAGGNSSDTELAVDRWVDGQWSRSFPLAAPRRSATGAPVPGGVILVSGSTYERWDPLLGTVSSGRLALGRGHAAVIPVPSALFPGAVLVASIDGPPEIIGRDPAGSTLAAGLHDWTRFASAVKLLDGRVLLAGGWAGAEREVGIYDPALDEWSYLAPLGAVSGMPALEALPDGRVLAIGSGGSGLGAELWDPVTGIWTPAAAPSAEHFPGETVTLSNGKVLAFAGRKDGGASLTADIELYDPATDTWTVVGALTSPRWRVKVVRLPDGMVLVAGGTLADGTPTAETFTW